MTEIISLKPRFTYVPYNIRTSNNWPSEINLCCNFICDCLRCRKKYVDTYFEYKLLQVSPVTTFDLDTEEWEEQDSAPQRTRGPFIKVEL